MLGLVSTRTFNREIESITKKAGHTESIMIKKHSTLSNNVETLEQKLYDLASEFEKSGSSLDTQNREIVDRLNILESCNKELVEQLGQYKEENKLLVEQIEKYDDENNSSLEDRPRFKVNNFINEDGKAELTVEYNETFIKYLKNIGFTGIDDDNIVSSWLSDMFQKQ